MVVSPELGDVLASTLVALLVGTEVGVSILLSPTLEAPAVTVT